MSKALDTLVSQVVADHRRYMASKQENDAAQAAILSKVVEMVRPAFPAIMSKVGERRAVLVLWGADSSLYLLETDKGEEWAVDGRPEWTGASMPTVVVLSMGYKLEHLIEGLADRLEEQVGGGKVKASERLEERAAKLRAVLGIL